MALSFSPKTEEQLRVENLLKIGEYDFDVLSADDVTSKAGNPMIKVNLGIYEGDAIRARVFDYLLSAMEAKLRHFCDTTGLLTKYEDGSLSAVDCRGRAGRVKIGIEEAEGSFPTKNVVKDYVVRKAKPITPAPAAPRPEDDDVPF